MNTQPKTAREYWKEKFDEYPQNDAEKLALAMMVGYATDCVIPFYTTPHTAQEGVSKEIDFPVQFGKSSMADFEENTWTFIMHEDFKIIAGEFAIVPKQNYSLPTTTSKAEGEDIWVKVEDGLPNAEDDSTAWAELKDYLVANDNGVKEHSFKFYQKGFWRIKDGDHFAVRLPGVTHWMPLPNPPKK